MISLTALAETRAKMTPGEYVAGDLDDPTGAVHVLSSSIIASRRCDDGNEDANASGLVATHNTADVLIEIARAALALRDAHCVLDTVEREMMYVGIVSVDQLLGVDTVRDAKVKVNEAGAALLAALGKVTL